MISKWSFWMVHLLLPKRIENVGLMSFPEIGSASPDDVERLRALVCQGVLHSCPGPKWVPFPDTKVDLFVTKKSRSARFRTTTGPILCAKKIGPRNENNSSQNDQSPSAKRKLWAIGTQVSPCSYIPTPIGLHLQRRHLVP